MLDDILWVIVRPHSQKWLNTKIIVSVWRTPGKAQSRLNQIVGNDADDHLYSIRQMTVFELLQLALQGREIG